MRGTSTVPEFCRAAPDLIRATQDALDALDRVLATRTQTQRDKLIALREIQASAKRMADGIEVRIRNISA